MTEKWATNYCKSMLPDDSTDEDIESCKVIMQDKIQNSLGLNVPNDSGVDES